MLSPSSSSSSVVSLCCEISTLGYDDLILSKLYPWFMLVMKCLTNVLSSSRKLYLLNSFQRGIQKPVKHLRWSFCKNRERLLDVWQDSECASSQLFVFCKFVFFIQKRSFGSLRYFFVFRSFWTQGRRNLWIFSKMVFVFGLLVVKFIINICKSDRSFLTY